MGFTYACVKLFNRSPYSLRRGTLDQAKCVRDSPNCRMERFECEICSPSLPRLRVPAKPRPLQQTRPLRHL